MFLRCAKKVITNTCITFTASTFLFLFFASIINKARASANVNSNRLYVLILFSFIIGLASLVFMIDKLHTAVKVALNFVICYVDMYICVFVIFTNVSSKSLMEGNYSSGQIMVGSVLFTVVYAIVVGVKLIIEHFENNKNKTKAYTKQFTEVS